MTKEEREELLQHIDHYEAQLITFDVSDKSEQAHDELMAYIDSITDVENVNRPTKKARR
jgi:hypothetical protein